MTALGVYTADELAQGIGVSPRTFYSYLSQGLLPDGRRVGRQVVYSSLHFYYGLLIRALVDGGVGLDAVNGILARLSSTQVHALAEPIAALFEARSRVEEELATATRQLRPPNVNLNLQELGLEDPIALQTRMAAWERELQSLGRQLDATFSEVRTRVLAEAGSGASPGSSNSQLPLSGLRADIQALTKSVCDLAIIVAAQVLGDEATRRAACSVADRLRRAQEVESEAP